MLMLETEVDGKALSQVGLEAGCEQDGDAATGGEAREPAQDGAGSCGGVVDLEDVVQLQSGGAGVADDEGAGPDPVGACGSGGSMHEPDGRLGWWDIPGASARRRSAGGPTLAADAASFAIHPDRRLS
jgi:hypothetical protein